MPVKAQHKCGCMLVRQNLTMPIAKCPSHGATRIDASHDWTHWIWYTMSHVDNGLTEGPRPSDKKEK